jgi:hypothetical protein
VDVAVKTFPNAPVRKSESDFTPLHSFISYITSSATAPRMTDTGQD